MATITTLLYIVACGRRKLDHPAPARDLYTSAHFRWALRQVETAARAAAAEVRILSALHGLVDPDQVLAPYDVTINHPDAVNPARVARQLRDLTQPTERVIEVRAFLPAAYLVTVTAAAQHADRLNLAAVTVHDGYQNAPGIGYQRQILARLTHRPVGTGRPKSVPGGRPRWS